MSTYKIELSQEQGHWRAVIIDLLVVGEGPDPETATADAVRKARGQEDALLLSGLARKRSDGSIRVLQRTGDIARRIGIEFGIRAVLSFRKFHCCARRLTAVRSTTTLASIACGRVRAC